MDTDYIPTIRFEIQGIKRMVVQAMGAVGSELGANVEERIDAAVKSFPWESKINSEVHNAINRSVDRYFKSGDGREVIDNIVSKSLNKTLSNINTTES